MAFFILLLLLISIIDISSRTIPDVLTISGLSIGFILSFFRKPFFFYQDALYGIFACGGILFVIAFCCLKIFKKEIMELGDIMLLGTIGAFCGLKGALFSLVAGSLLGAIIGMPLMITKSKSAKYAIPFGPFLSFGAVFFMYFGDRFVYGFLRLLSGSMH
jgi:leader peptidase (prepilin peptidase)/N-methyltransferase